MNKSVFAWAALLLLGCSLDNSTQPLGPWLPRGLFRHVSPVQIAKVDSQGYLTQWVDTAEFFIRVAGLNQWEESMRVNDTCTAWRVEAQFQFISDTLFLTKSHGSNYKIESKGCAEIAYEYRADSTVKVPVAYFSEYHIDLKPPENPFGKVVRYDRVDYR